MSEIKHPLFEEAYYHGPAPAPSEVAGSGETVDVPFVPPPLSPEEEAAVRDADEAAQAEADESVAEDDAAADESAAEDAAAKDDETQPARRGRNR